MSSAEASINSHDKNESHHDSFHLESSGLHQQTPQGALLEQRTLSAHNSNTPASAADLLPSLAIIFAERPVPAVFQPDAPLDATQGWKTYDGAFPDSIGRGADGSLRLKGDSTSVSNQPSGYFKKLDLPVGSSAPDNSTREKVADGLADELPMHVQFFARTSSSSKPEQLNVSVIESKAPFAQTMNENVSVGANFKEFDFDCVAPETKDGLSLHFKLNGDIEIKNISVSPESVSALGVNPKDLTESGIEQNIDKNRKTALNITVVDASGKPIPNANVELEQKTQSFLFGTEVQGLNPSDPSQGQSNYQSALKANFNFATVTPYFPQTAAPVPTDAGHGNAGLTPGADKIPETKTDYSKFDQQIAWLSAPAQNMDVKLTPVFWPHFTPTFVPENPSIAMKMADDHTRDFMEHFSKSPNIRVIENNEVVAALTDRGGNGVTKWVQQDAAKNNDNGAHVVEQETAIEKGVLKDAPNKSIQIMYNDYVNNDEELKMLDKLQKDGKLPDQIGVQMHMTQGEWPLARVEQIVDEVGKYGKPIFISEISVISGEHRIGQDGKDTSKINWPSTADGEQRQADYTEKLYRLLYSNPNVHGITWWDLSDKNSWQGAPRGLLRADMSQKPAFEGLHQLIRHDWMSEETRTTNNAGEADQRMFTGDYDITVTDAQGHRVKGNVYVNKTSGDSTALKIQMPSN